MREVGLASVVADSGRPRDTPKESPALTPGSVETMLRGAAPFKNLPPEAMRWLAAHLQCAQAGPGEAIVREGELGDAMYLINRGMVSVTVAEAGSRGGERELAQLGPGDVFGEQSLLTGDPRAATVRAIGTVDLYKFGLVDFQTAQHLFPDQQRDLVALAMRRQRPMRITTWTMVRESTGDHSILKNTRTAAYLRLSEPAAFLWNQMDGRNTVRDLTRAYLERYGTFDLDAVLSVMDSLLSAGFVQIQALSGPRAPAPGSLPARSALRLVSQYISIPHADHVVNVLYSSVYRHLMNRVAQILFLLVAVTGALLFLKMFFWHGLPLRSAGHPLGVVAIGIGGLAIQVLMHEIGHAVTCKHFGREVRRAGVGWYLFMPVAFVDTSDIWMAGRWPRIAVSIAGPYTNLVLSGLASLAMPFATGQTAAALAHFALVGYVLTLMNLNPLIEYDGYYVLMDWLGIPNLRARALALVGAIITRRPTAVAGARLRRLLGSYGVLALVYTSMITYAILAGYHRYLEAGASQLMPHSWATGLGWLLAGLMAWLILRRAWRDLHLR